jgi:hypothetical protein
MSNVIIPQITSWRVRGRIVTQREAFLNIVAAELDEEDFAEFVDAVNDPAYYTTVDTEIQDLVDGFFACKA